MNGNFGGGEGTESSPYKIEDIEDFLKMICCHKGDALLTTSSYFELTKDLDFSEFEEYKWEFPKISMPSGSGIQYHHFDGKNHTIKNMIFRKNSIDRIFQYLADLKNLNLENICLINYPNSSLLSIKSKANNVNISVFLFNSYPYSIFYRNYTDMLFEDCTFNIKGFCREYFYFPSNCKRCHFNFDISCLLDSYYLGQNGRMNGSLENCYFTGEIRARNSSSYSTFYLCQSDPTFINSYFNIKLDLKNTGISELRVYGNSGGGKENTRVTFLNKDALLLPEECTIPKNEGEFYFLDYEQCCDPAYLLDELGFPVIQTDE